MRTRLRHIWQALKSSYWFVPSIMMAATIGLASLILWIDERWQPEEQLLRVFYGGGAEGARALLSTIASSVITVAGVVFSITIAALTQASTQFGPRLLRNFIRDRGNQFVLGTFTSTFVYCILVVRTIRGGDDEGQFVPNISVTVAVALALASIGVLIFFIHHVANSIQGPVVISTAAAELLSAIEETFPWDRQDGGSPPRRDRPPRDQAHAIRADRSGFLQAIDQQTLLRDACQRDLLVELCVRPGDFIMRDAVVALAWPSGRCDDSLGEAITSSLIIGRQPTEEQDLEFSVHQLVEIAARALSPGINDPITANECVDWLSAAIAEAARRPQPPSHPQNDDAQRLLLRTWDLEGLIEAAFNPIRQYAAENVPVIIRLLERLGELAERVQTSRAVNALRQQALAIEEALKIKDLTEFDRNAIDQRRAQVLRQLGTPKARDQTFRNKAVGGGQVANENRA